MLKSNYRQIAHWYTRGNYDEMYEINGYGSRYQGYQLPVPHYMSIKATFRLRVRQPYHTLEGPVQATTLPRPRAHHLGLIAANATTSHASLCT
eukprot:4386783-Amphidinium_carterae.1